MSMALQSTSQSTPTKPKLTPISRHIPLHPSKLSHLVHGQSSQPDNPGPNTNQTPSIADLGTFPALTLFPLIVIISCCLIPSDPVLTILVHTLDFFTLTSTYPQLLTTTLHI